MKLKCVSKKVLQDKYDSKTFYKPGREYDFDDKRAKELLKSKLFEEVKSKKDIKEDTK